jgi:hypothetical protein
LIFRISQNILLPNIPEPTTLLLLGLGAVILRRKKHNIFLKEMIMTTEERLEKLERRNRLLLIGLVLAVAVFVLGALADEKTFNIIRANRFILEGENGKLRAVLEVDKSGSTSLSMRDENEKIRTILSVSKDELGLYLYNENEKPRTILSMSKNEPGLMLLDENGKERAMLSIKNNSPGLSMFDADGKNRAMLRIFENMPGLSLRDENGKNRVMLSVFKNEPSLYLLNADGQTRWRTP